MFMGNMNGRSDDMKVVYLWKNGQQVLVFSNSDGEYVYPKDKWTEQKPPTGIYAPFYYDGKSWIGQSKEDFESNVEIPEVEPDEKDVMISSLLQQNVEQQAQIDSIQKDIATLMELFMTGGNTNV